VGSTHIALCISSVGRKTPIWASYGHRTNCRCVCVGTTGPPSSASAPQREHLKHRRLSLRSTRPAYPTFTRSRSASPRPTYTESNRPSIGLHTDSEHNLHKFDHNLRNRSRPASTTSQQNPHQSPQTAGGTQPSFNKLQAQLHQTADRIQLPSPTSSTT
jgi:hypothetical protein